MDINYFHHRQQVSQYMSENAACDCSRMVHRKLADAYALLIASAKSATTKRAMPRVAAA